LPLVQIKYESHNKISNIQDLTLWPLWPEDDTLTELEKVFEIDTLLYGAPLYPEGWDHE